MSRDEAQLLQAIRDAAPEDNSAQLAYADWCRVNNLPPVTVERAKAAAAAILRDQDKWTAGVGMEVWEKAYYGMLSIAFILARRRQEETGQPLDTIPMWLAEEGR